MGGGGFGGGGGGGGGVWGGGERLLDSSFSLNCLLPSFLFRKLTLESSLSP